MTVIDQLRAHEHCAVREQTLIKGAQMLLDVLTGDLEREALHKALQEATDNLAALLVELDDRPPAAPKGITNPVRRTPTKNRKTKKTTKKAARRPQVPPPAAAGQAVTSKTCPDCDQLLPADQFGRHARTKDGLQPRCRTCAGKRTKAGRDASQAAKRDADRVTQITSPSTPAAPARPPRPGELAVVCPKHGVIARGRPDHLQTETGWKFQQQARHRRTTGCAQDVELKAVQPA